MSKSSSDHYAPDVLTTTWRERIYLTAPFAAAALLAVFTPSDEGPTVCAFALCTGTACPGCGMTRAASYLIRGDFGSAFTYHPLVPLVAFQVAAGWIWFALRRAGKVGPMSQRVLNIFLIGTAVAFLAVWAFRFAAGTLPPV